MELCDRGLTKGALLSWPDHRHREQAFIVVRSAQPAQQHSQHAIESADALRSNCQLQMSVSR